jgi:hypothetical protein
MCDDWDIPTRFLWGLKVSRFYVHQVTQTVRRLLEDPVLGSIASPGPNAEKQDDEGRPLEMPTDAV